MALTGPAFQTYMALGGHWGWGWLHDRFLRHRPSQQERGTFFPDKSQVCVWDFRPNCVQVQGKELLRRHWISLCEIRTNTLCIKNINHLAILTWLIIQQATIKIVRKGRISRTPRWAVSTELCTGKRFWKELLRPVAVLSTAHLHLSPAPCSPLAPSGLPWFGATITLVRPQLSRQKW